MPTIGQVEVMSLLGDDVNAVVTDDALDFVVELHRRFAGRWHAILAAREQRDAALRAGWSLDFQRDTRAIRDDDWQVAPPRDDYADRRVEVVGPADAQTLVVGLNSGACGFLADLEDALSPTWRNVLESQRNLVEAVHGTLQTAGEDGRVGIGPEPATLLVRPRGWHLPEWHLRVAGEPVAGALVDFGLYAFHCAHRLLAADSAVYLYLPKLEHHHEAKLWADVFHFTERRLDLPTGSIRATVLIETLPAAFQMHEILWELRDHAYGLNAGRWDYLFSTIKCFRDRPQFVLPHWDEVDMNAPFLRAYTELLVETCHRRGTFAVGGMAPGAPARARSDVDADAFASLRADKRREADDGFDGTWVARPDMVHVAMAVFDGVLGPQRNQIFRPRRPVDVTAADLLDIGRRPPELTLARLRRDIRRGLSYIASWLSGSGVAEVDDLPEDATAAEICRAQIWQWIRHGVRLEDGQVVTRRLVGEIVDQEMTAMQVEMGPRKWERARPEEARRIFEQVALTDEFPAFLTLPAYEVLY